MPRNFTRSKEPHQRHVAQRMPHDLQFGTWCAEVRPATPSNVPLIDKTKLPNFYLNTGHGTLGWTHSCGSGKSIARIVSGLAPEVDFAFTGMPAQATRVLQPA